MDSITLNDIFKAYEITDKKRDEGFAEAEIKYQKRYPVLLQYEILLPYNYKKSLVPGKIIRYSENFNKLSCASRIIEVIHTLDGKNIKKLKLVALNKKNNSGVWEIGVDIYYIFLFMRKIPRMKWILGGFGFNTIDAVTKNKDNIEKIFKGGNNLDFEKLKKADPTIGAKIITAEMTENYADATANHKEDKVYDIRKMKLLEDETEQYDSDSYDNDNDYDDDYDNDDYDYDDYDSNKT